MFPILTDEMVDIFEAEKLLHEGEPHANWLSVSSVHNARPHCEHLVSTSLFWKNDVTGEGDLPAINREIMIEAAELGLAGRFPPWEGYVLPLIEGAKILRHARPKAVLRVYLANDLAFLIEDLTKVGCEVYLMCSCSIRHSPGAMWRFLALEISSCPITVIDADQGKWILSNIARTEASQKVGVGGWRVPYNCGGDIEEGYRPFSASQFGSSQSYPMMLLMEAFIWHNLCGTMPTKCKLVGQRENEIVGTAWPDYGFDEWFLLAVVYPRMAFNGLLTFLPWDLPPLGQFFALDIEYTSWANPKSELIYYANPKNALGYAFRPWEEWKSEARLKIRSETTVVRRGRKKLGARQGIFENTQRDGIGEFTNYAGDLPSFLAGASAHVTEPWFVDLNPQLHLSADGGELFLDRRYEDCELVFCGYYFIKITAAISDWAVRNELDENVWGEGNLLKVPKLEGPVALWRTEFSWRFHDELVSQVPFVKPEILLRAWMDQGKVTFAETTAKQMGWRVR